MDDSSREWRKETVSYAAADPGECIRAYLFLPKNAKPPYQVMVSSGVSLDCMSAPAPQRRNFDRYTFIVRSGRAFLYPIYKSMFERADDFKE